MRIFSQTVFDSYMSSGAAVYTYTDPSFDELLGSAEKLSIQAICDQVGGSSPTLTVALQHSADRRNWAAKNASGEILTASLSSPSDVKYGQDTGTVPGLAYGRLQIVMGGGTPTCRLRIVVTGHAETSY